MCANEKSLQKLTVKQKIKSLFELEKITFSDINRVLETKAEKRAFNKEFTRRFNEYRKEARDSFLRQVDEIMGDNNKNIVWENNHLEITQFLNQYICEYGQMPSKSRIAECTKLSRQTVHKHFKDYASSTIYKEQYEQFKIMRDKVLAMVFQIAKTGDVKACKLFLEVVSDRPIGAQERPALSQTQNNYIQINNLKIEQEQIRNLSPEQLKVLESVFVR